MTQATMQNEVTRQDRDAAARVDFTLTDEMHLSLISAFAAHRIAAAKEAEQAVLEKALAAIIDVRARNAGNFDRKGAVWEAYDRAVLDCHAAVAALAQEKPDA